MISLVVALPAEARPIVRRFALDRDPGGRPAVYRGGELELIVSGVGASAAATAVERLGGGEGRRPRGWINFGIAGHRELAVGTIRLAHKIVDARDGRSWYPPAVFEPPCSGAVVRTVGEVERAPADDALHEMEAAGFYPAALRFATAELIQVLKVVSDNPGSPPERLTAAAVEELSEGGLETLEALVAKVGAVAGALEERLAPPPALEDFLGRWRFTVTQKRQLERLLRRLASLGRPAAPDSLAGSRSAAAVLSTLRERL